MDESVSDVGESSQDPELKKAAATLIGRYYTQLTIGCGNSSCENVNCASSPKFQVGNLSSNEAAVKALQLCRERASLCDVDNTRTNRSSDQPDSGTAPSSQVEAMDVTCSEGASSTSAATTKPIEKPDNEESSEFSNGLSEDQLISIVDECKNSKDYARIRSMLWVIFSNEALLKKSFLIEREKNTDHLLFNSVSDVFSDKNNLNVKGNSDISKEQLQGAQCDLDKDLDSLESLPEKSDTEIDCTDKDNSSESSSSSSTKSKKDLVLDVQAVRRSYKLLFECPEEEFGYALVNAIIALLDSLTIKLKYYKDEYTADSLNLNTFLILIECPALTSTEYLENVLGHLSSVISQLSVQQRAEIVRHFAKLWEPARLHDLLQSLHQLITIKLMTTEFTRIYTINEDTNITSATKFVELVYYACIIGGTLDTPLLKDIPPEEPSSSAFSSNFLLENTKDGLERPPPWDALAKELGIHPLDSREPLVPYDDFYDDFLSDQLEMDRDFAYYKAENGDKFSFLEYPFILNPATKSLGLYYDNRIRMYSERRMSIFHTVIAGTPSNPYLKLRIRRDHIINDALMGLELVALDNPQDLKKQLVVEFEGEQGVDEGGISKEFFQLIIEQLFNPDYAMFCLNEETQTFWFNPTSFENGAQFSLVGIVLGLAIYNNVILDLHFPPVMYKKLCGKPGSFHDLKGWNTTLHRSLEELLKYEGDDMEDVFLQSYRIGYQDIFGANLHHDLIPDGENVLVGQHNKKEFVELYADFLLNKMADQQFSAFRKGFCMVTDDSPLQHLFRPQELELLVCGSKQYDFAELMNSTEYDAGYCSDTEIISWFWDLVHQMSDEEKKQLLQFTTGSARVPVGGLARLKLIIARHGPDTDHLPTAHTCFNVLLLPEYSTKEKLKDRLLKAIKYAQGFGML